MILFASEGTGSRYPAWFAFLLWAAVPARSGNQILVSGVYGGTMGAGAATAAEPIAFGQNPGGGRVPDTKPYRAGFQMDFHRPYGMEEIRVADAGAFCDFSRAGLGISWRETGVDDLYRERAVSINPRLHLGPFRSRFPGRLDVGASWNVASTVIPGEVGNWVPSQGYGAVWSVLPRLKLGAYGLELPWPGSRSASEPVWQWGFAADSREADAKGLSRPRQTLYLDFRKTGNAPWRALGALALALHPSLQAFAGLSTPPFQVSFGLKAGWGGLGWNQAFRYHRYLGRTAISGLSFSR